MGEERNVMDGLVTVLVDKFCGKQDLEDLPIGIQRTKPLNPARDAKLVYDYLTALEHEGRIRSLHQFADAASQADAGIARLWERRDTKGASAVITAFGRGLAEGPTLAVKAMGITFSAMAQDVAPGAINDKAVAEARKQIAEIGRKVLLEIVVLRRQAPDRGPDAWRPELLAEAERSLDGPEAKP